MGLTLCFEFKQLENPDIPYLNSLPQFKTLILIFSSVEKLKRVSKRKKAKINMENERSSKVFIVWIGLEASITFILYFL